MPKVPTTGWQLPYEPTLADVPIRLSARTPRFPNGRLPKNEWVETSRMPSLRAPPQAVVWPYVQGGDVTMASAPGVPVKTEPEGWQVVPAVGSGDSSGEALHPVELHASVGRAQMQLPVVQTSRQVPEDVLHSVTVEAQRFPESQIRLVPNVPLVSSEIDELVKPQVQAERTSRAQGMEVEGPRQAFGANRTLGETQRAMGEAEEWFRTEVAVEAIDSLNLRIHKFEKNEQRLKRQLREEKDRVKNSKAAEEGTLNLLVLAEERRQNNLRIQRTPLIKQSFRPPRPLVTSTRQFLSVVCTRQKPFHVISFLMSGRVMPVSYTTGCRRRFTRQGQFMKESTPGIGDEALLGFVGMSVGVGEVTGSGHLIHVWVVGGGSQVGGDGDEGALPTIARKSPFVVVQRSHLESLSPGGLKGVWCRREAQREKGGKGEVKRNGGLKDPSPSAAMAGTTRDCQLWCGTSSRAADHLIQWWATPLSGFNEDGSGPPPPCAQCVACLCLFNSKGDELGITNWHPGSLQTAGDCRHDYRAPGALCRWSSSGGYSKEADLSCQSNMKASQISRQDTKWRAGP
ncbi:hypothetical protein FA13DRAFT_1707429 [Coprinellus micaceus]|uniref:Uncharacterized protein n=1 Tax=Coprinellus micaceus TaxID=71717 RepID=A0A4Y7TKR6_COPMI|nr:hypothetical protein FA13DRAFT_1707429 [Coprinellus micaceus]